MLFAFALLCTRNTLTHSVILLSSSAFRFNLRRYILAVQVFGIFIAIMVVLNYIAVVSWFPACVAFWAGAYTRPHVSST